jgi:hypothetical protein
VSTRRCKTVVPIVEKAIEVMEANRKKRKKPEWQSIRSTAKNLDWTQVCQFGCVIYRVF